MKFLALLLLAISATSAVALPAPEAEPDKVLVPRRTCTRVLQWWPDRLGVCVNLATDYANCKGGKLYKADCGSLGKDWYCCII